MRAFKRDECLVNGCGGWIGGRNDRCNHSHWARHFHNAFFAVFGEDSYSAHAANRPLNVHRRKTILRCLVSDVAEARLLDGPASKRFSGGCSGGGARFNDGVDVILGKSSKLFLGGGGQGHQAAGLLDGDQIRVT